jgi:hypothetical protein
VGGCACYFHTEEGWVVETLLYCRQVFLDDILTYSRRKEELDKLCAWCYSVYEGKNHGNCRNALLSIKDSSIVACYL